MRFLTGRVSHAVTYEDRALVLRPNTRMNTNIRVKATRVVGKLGRILATRASYYVTLRAVTKGKSRVKQGFRRLTQVCSKIIRGSGLEIYFSAYRADSDKCSVVRRFSSIVRSFSHLLKGSRVTIFRVGSDGGVPKTTGSQRRGVNFKRVNFSTVSAVIRRPSFRSMPGVLRAPCVPSMAGTGGSCTPCGCRVRVLEGGQFSPRVGSRVLTSYRWGAV